MTPGFLHDLELNDDLLRDIFEWDIKNWSRAVPFWAKEMQPFRNRKVLELGARGGGLSLLYALCGANVICSDFGGPADSATTLHSKYDLSNEVIYTDIDATRISMPDNSVDFVVFKSILGGIGWNDNTCARNEAVSEILRVLRPGGYLLFAENLRGCRLHTYLRKRFVHWGDNWNYLEKDNVQKIFFGYDSLRFQSWGFIGNLGRNNWQRNALSLFDQSMMPLIPQSWRYILFGVARKPL